MSRMRIALGATTTVLLATGGAIAATPESGKVDNANPKVEWAGETIGSFLSVNPMANSPEDFPCVPPSCDTFTLTVGDGPQELTIGADVQDGDGDGGNVFIRLTAPDGTVTFTEGTADDGKPAKVKVKKAVSGEYIVDYLNNFIDGPIPYAAFAELGVAAPAAPAPAPPTSGPAPAPAPGSEPKESYTITVKAGKLSATKIRKTRKAAATVTVSRPVKSITAQLRKGKTVVGKGAVGMTTKTAKVTLKVAKKLKPGKYTLAVAATSDQDVKAFKTVKVTVKK
jgi:hypothetical protein